MSEKGRRMTSAARVLHLERSASRENKRAGQGGTPDRLYTPLAAKPQGGAFSIMLPRHPDQAPGARRDLAGLAR